MRLNPLASLARRLRPLLGRRPKRETVLFTEDHLVLVWPERGEEAVAWDDIGHIALRRMDGAAGPEGLFVYVMAGRARLVIPPSADNRQALLDFVRGLPACDTATLDRVLAGAHPAVLPAGLVTVWRRPGT